MVLSAIEQGGIVIVAHLQWLGDSVNTVSSDGPRRFAASYDTEDLSTSFVLNTVIFIISKDTFSHSINIRFRGRKKDRNIYTASLVILYCIQIMKYFDSSEIITQGAYETHRSLDKQFQSINMNMAKRSWRRWFNILSLFRYYLPFGKDVALNMNKLKFLSHKNALCQNWLKSIQSTILYIPIMLCVFINSQTVYFSPYLSIYTI